MHFSITSSVAFAVLSYIQAAAASAEAPGCIFYVTSAASTSDAFWAAAGASPQAWSDMIVWCEAKKLPDGRFPIVDPIDPTIGQPSVPKYEPKCQHLFNGKLHGEVTVAERPDYAGVPQVEALLAAHPDSIVCRVNQAA